MLPLTEMIADTTSDDAQRLVARARLLLNSGRAEKADAADLIDDLWAKSLPLISATVRAQGEGRSAEHELIALLWQLREAEMSHRRGLDQQVSVAALAALQRRLSAVDSVAELFASAPGWIGEMGFDRVLLSRVEDNIWVPYAMFVRNDPSWAKDIMQAGHEEPASLSGVLVETDVVADSATLVVEEVQTHPRVHPSIARVSRSDNYGVVPLEHRGHVVGMLHADCYFQRRTVTAEQVAALDVAGHAVAAAWGRTSMAEKLRNVEDLDSGGGDALTGWSKTVKTLPRTCSSADVPLTAREVQVLRLMAGGETNYRIARLLDISEATAKTHVKHVLAKLGAANRAEAVSRWLQRAS